MVKLYVLKIQRGEMSLDDVPKYWRGKVEAELNNGTEDEK